MTIQQINRNFLLVKMINFILLLCIVSDVSGQVIGVDTSAIYKNIFNKGNNKYQLIQSKTIKSRSTIITYNEDGQLLTKQNKNDEGQFILDENGVAIYKYEYNDVGKLKKIKHFDVFGVLCQNEKRPSIIEYVYNDKKQLIEKKYLNDKARLINIPTPIVRFTYDKNGVLIKEILCDIDGNPIKTTMD